MYLTVPIAMFGWPLVVIALFLILPPRRAVLIAFLGAWLFLPIAQFKVAGIPDYSKVTATVLGVLIGAILFDFGRLLALRPRWMDIPMLVWCLCPFVTSIQNGLGAYDGLSSTFFQSLLWGIPYIIGRAYFQDFEGMRDLTLAILIGGLIYVPLCLFEIRFSPQLHHWIYGFTQAQFAQTKRYGGFRPLVFMQTGLAVGLWMADATLIAVWFWSTKSLRYIGTIPISIAALVLLGTTLLCKSTGALLILLIGFGVLFLCSRFKSALPFFCMVLLIPAYIGLRIDNAVSPDEVESALNHFFDSSRVQSFMFRVRNEQLLTEKALQKPFWGWGGWSRSEIKNDNGKNTTITDSMWVIALGHHGLVGLISLFATLLLPASVTWYRFTPRRSSDIRLTSLHLLTLLQVLFAVDCLSNAMPNPIYILAIGGASSLLLRPARAENMETPAAAARRQRRATITRPVRSVIT